MGTGCGLFDVRKIGDEYFTYVTECKDPKACTIVLRGASKDILNEVGVAIYSWKLCVHIHTHTHRWSETFRMQCKWSET